MEARKVLRGAWKSPVFALTHHPREHEEDASAVLTNNSSPLNRLHLAWDIGGLPADDLGPAPLFLYDSLSSRVTLRAEVLALRHQILVLRRGKQKRRVKVSPTYRPLWAWLSRLWPGWRSALRIVKPETVIAWHGKGFRHYWSRKSRPRQDRPPVSAELRELIRRMGTASWGAPRIHGELGTLGLQVSETTVAKYRCGTGDRPLRPGVLSLNNHVKDLVSADFLVVPTAMFRLPFVFALGQRSAFSASTVSFRACWPFGHH